MSKLIEACSCGYRTLFVRVGEREEFGGGMYLEHVNGDRGARSGNIPPRPLTISALNGLVGLIGSRFPDLDYHVVYAFEGWEAVPGEMADAPPDRRLSLLSLGKLDGPVWVDDRYSDESNWQWDQFLASLSAVAGRPLLFRRGRSRRLPEADPPGHGSADRRVPSGAPHTFYPARRATPGPCRRLCFIARLLRSGNLLHQDNRGQRVYCPHRGAVPIPRLSAPGVWLARTNDIHS